jgi:hypothetical protein
MRIPFVNNFLTWVLAATRLLTHEIFFLGKVPGGRIGHRLSRVVYPRRKYRRGYRYATG